MNSSCERIQQVIRTATAGMSPQQLEWKPAGKWSAADILEHLMLSYAGTTLGSNKCLEMGKPIARKSTLKDRVVTLVVVALGYLPNGREAPEMTKPKGLRGADAMERFDRELANMDSAIALCEQRFGRHNKLMNHPIIGPLTTNEWRKFHLVHACHHAKQIKRLRDSLQGKQ